MGVRDPGISKMMFADAVARCELARLEFQATRETTGKLLSLLGPLLEAHAAGRRRLATLRQAADAAAAVARARRANACVRPLAIVDVDRLHSEYATSRKPELRDRLVESHGALAYGLASRFLHRGESTEDLQQVALLALVNAVDRFDPDRGLQFSTFATPTILGELKRHFRDRAWAIRLPRRLHDRYLLVQRARDDLAQELGRTPTIAELAVRVESSEEEILEAMEAGEARTMKSLDAPPGFSQDDRDLASTVGEPDDAMVAVDRRFLLAQLLARLSPRERDIIHMRFFDGLTQMQIADKLGTNQMHVSRLLGRSLRRLRALAGEP